MSTKIEQLYGPEHYDSGYFAAMRDWLATQQFKRGIEIGFAWAMSAHAYLETQESNLISLDIADNMHKGDGIREVFPGRWELITGDSSTNLLKQKGKFDYIYIDGDHTYDGCRKDLEAAHKKLETGGVIVCDDYGNPCGVKQAVDEFCEKYGYGLEAMANNQNGGVILRVKS